MVRYAYLVTRKSHEPYVAYVDYVGWHEGSDYIEYCCLCHDSEQSRFALPSGGVGIGSAR